MKKQSICGNCHQKFWSNVTKVYVFKRHFCPDHKEEVLNFDGKNIFTCPTCNRAFRKDDILEYGLMGTSMMGTTRKWEDVQKRMTDGKTDYEAIQVPIDQYCGKCMNFIRQRMQAEHNEQMRENYGGGKAREFPKSITSADIYRHEIHAKVQRDFRAEQQRLQQMERAKAQEEYAKVKRESKGK